ncbi:hypothetical protein AAHA92_29697 [Salvia divinorum]|uniref:Uncharacterized protein n=1 Tax=Salvia divinorum TaxID=28513 RepID=A0ABD1FZ79_SALDI
MAKSRTVTSPRCNSLAPMMFTGTSKQQKGWLEQLIRRGLILF